MKSSPRLLELARKLQNPRDYEKGWVASPLVIAESILVFSRQLRKQLLDAPPKVHHHRFVLIVSVDGQGDVCIDERVFHMKKEKVLLIFPFQFHHFLSFSQSRICWLFFTFELKHPSLLEPLKNSIRNATPEIFDLLEDILGCTASFRIPSPDRTARAQLRVALLLEQLLQQAPDSLASSVMPDSDEGVEILEKTNRFLYNNIGRLFSLKELARDIGYSESHLRHLFRSSLRMSVGRYINEMRLRRATGLLHQGKMNISQVATACGYASLYSFSRTFKHALGCSPREFRKKCDARP